MRRKSFGVVGALLVGALAALGFTWPFGKRDEVLKLPGIVEIHEVRLGARVAGRVREVLVTEGDKVQAGQPLVVLDVPELHAQRKVLEAKLRDFAAAMRMEYRLTQHFMAGHDFYEGVRAAVLDKDQAPRWQPATLADVSDEAVERYFAPLDEPDLDLPGD